jgi:hypothetical protein
VRRLVDVAGPRRLVLTSGDTQLPAFGLGGVLLASFVLLGAALWLWRRSRGGTDVTLWAIVAGMAGLGVAGLVLFAEGMRHFGGSVQVDAGDYVSACSVWWQEIGLPSGQSAAVGDYSTTCHHDAVHAIGPALLTAAVLGLATAVLVLALFALARRRRSRVRR